MSREDSDAITIAVRLDDPVVADRIGAILGEVTGLRLVTRDEPADAMLVSSHDVHDGRIANDSDAVAAEGVAASAITSAPLTPREREVLALLVEGASNKAIARRLGISVHTAKFHVGSLLDKLDATGRTDAVTHAARLGVIEL